MNAATQKEAWREVYMTLNEFERIAYALIEVQKRLTKLEEMLTEKPRKPRTKKPPEPGLI